MYGIPIIRANILIEIPIVQTTVGTTILFPDEPTLRGKGVLVDAIETWSSDQMSVAPSGNSVVTSDGLKGIVINLQELKTSMNKVQLYPLVGFNPVVNNGVTKEFRPFPLSVTKCSIQITDNANITTNESVVLSVWYHFENE